MFWRCRILRQRMLGGQSMGEPIRLGVLGGGQLGKMLAQSAATLGVRTRVWDTTPDVPAGGVSEVIAAAFDDADALDVFAGGLAAATYEFENVPAATASAVGERVVLSPGIESLEATQERLTEKRVLERAGIAVAPHEGVDERGELARAALRVGYPLVMKARRLGYDGRGQAWVRSEGELDEAWRSLGGQPVLLEGAIGFERELSLVCVRSRDGDFRAYPLVENRHTEGILRTTIAPAARVSSSMQSDAEGLAEGLAASLGHVGVLTVEFFEVGGRLIANEIAPRVHNSGHWTIEGAATSQFAQHVRAVLGWPIGSCVARGSWAMVNLIGVMPARDRVLRIDGAHLHDYAKSPRPGRKLGHVTVGACDASSLAERLEAVERAVFG